MQIGFIGLGNMGGPMARNLLGAGHQVAAFDLVAEALAKLSEAGARSGGSPREVVQGADVVVSMLPASHHVEGLYLAPDADGKCLLDLIGKDTLVVDSSTIAPASARKVAEAARARGIAMLDAPVSGGTAGAEKGTLTFMVGGEAEHLARAKPVLEVMGANIFHAGASGAGQVAKICNNMLLAIHMAGTAEAIALGVANGLDPTALSEIMRRSSGGNWSLEVYNPWPGVMDGVPASREYQGGFLVDLMLKDLALALQAGEQVGSGTPMGSLARSLYAIVRSQHDAGRLDFSAIQKLYGQK
jgi:3-hydroxyisobutyrate dehydrogenase